VSVCLFGIILLQSGVAPGYGFVAGIIGVGLSFAGAVDEHEQGPPEDT
jgi:hypothetical protein